ncbi:MAG: histidine kinase [Amaricoccus sp.]
MTRWLGSWRELPLARRFGLAGGAVMLVAMLLVGFWITERIQRAVIDNTAAASALYMESFISPLSQELARQDALSEPAVLALQEMMSGTPLGARVVSLKIWKPGGYVVYASDPAIVGKHLPPTAAQKTAWGGQVAAHFDGLDADENRHEAALGLPLLEIYSPIRQVWSGEVIAVAEFYTVEDGLVGELQRARAESWVFVAAVFLGAGLLLFGIVQAGSRTILRQQAALSDEARRSQAIARQNADLRRRAVGASARAAAQTERTLRQVSADLHDGPAQYLGLAALRLDRVMPATEEGRAEAAAIRAALDLALGEVRAISRGLSLPDLDRLPLDELVRRAVEIHQGQSEMRVLLDFRGPPDPALDQSAKICVYRFLQEALSNVARHAPGATARVQVATGLRLEARVEDDGPGFDPETDLGMRPDGGQGLAGLRDRAESIGGEFAIETGTGRGTRLMLTLPLLKGSE